MLFPRTTLFPFGKLWLFTLTFFVTSSTVVRAGEQSAALTYQPNKIGNGVIGGIYGLCSLCLFYHTLSRRLKWPLWLPAGALTSAIGYFLRLALDRDNFVLGLYIIQNLLVILSPALFLAFNYMVLGRFITAIDPALETDHKANRLMQKSQYSWIPPRLVSRIFLWSDVITWVIQCSGGGLQAQGGTVAQLGNKLFLIGVIVQGASYCIFTTVLVYANVRLHKEDPTIFSGWRHPIAKLSGALYFSSVFIIIRSIYRIVEFAQGYQGYLIRHEAFLFALDAAPIILAIIIWIPFWPTNLIDASRRSSQSDYSYIRGGNVPLDTRYSPEKTGPPYIHGGSYA